MRVADYLVNTPSEVPAAIRGLIDATMAAFDTDRNISRRYLWCASARVCEKKCGAPRGESGRRSAFRSSWLTRKLNRVLDYIVRQLADKTTAMSLAGSINVSSGHLFRTLKSRLPAKTPVGGSAPDTVRTRLYLISVGGTPP